MTNLSNLFEWLKISNRPKHLKSRYHYFYHLDWLSPSSYHHDYPTSCIDRCNMRICSNVCCRIYSKKHWWEMGLAGHFGRNTPSYNCSFDYLPIWSF